MSSGCAGAPSAPVLCHGPALWSPPSGSGGNGNYGACVGELPPDPQTAKLSCLPRKKPIIQYTSLVPRPRGRREKWPGIHYLCMRNQFWKCSANESDYV